MHPRASSIDPLVKNPLESCAGNPSSISGSGRSAGKGIGFPLQYSWASLGAQLVMRRGQFMGLFYFDFGQGSLHWKGDVRAKIWLRQNMLNLKNEDVTQREQDGQRPWNESMPWMCASSKKEVRVIWKWVSGGGDEIPEGARVTRSGRAWLVGHPPAHCAFDSEGAT